MSKTPSIIVPARIESTRFPRKLLHLVRGKPIILWTADRIRAVAPDFPLYFAVDDDSLDRCLTQAGYSTIRTSHDHRSGTDRLAEANLLVGADTVINVQGDEPMVTEEQILSLAAGIQGEVSIATLATPFICPDDFTNPNQVKVVLDKAGFALYFSRSPIPFARHINGKVDIPWLASNALYRHLGLYAYKADFLNAFSGLVPGFLEQTEKLEQLRALEHGYRIHVAITEQTTVSIDTAKDIAEFEAQLD